ncbi:MAG TPA: family 1 glycosylhydrolase [Spirochaetota bacterium]|nr:family 1 glycosylhydrolase [Spirochaetota bacterium]
MKKFPEGFYFGAATSSHQVEGGCVNDWSVWEKQNAERLASESVKYSSLPSWNSIKDKAMDPRNYISGVAADHFNRYEEDFDIAKKIGLNAYRFSIEWSRIEPEPGRWNENAIDHYKAMVLALRKRKIEPFVTIWHWTLPLWLSDTGGIMNKDFPVLFARYSQKLAQAFGSDVRYYIIINEPEIYALNSYMLGIWPPQKKGIVSYIRAMKILVRSHRLASAAIKQENSTAMTGPACNMSFFESGGGVNRIFTYFAERFWNRHFISRTLKYNDFIGINYYFHNRINYGLNRNANEKVSDMGWELYPQGIENIVMGMTGYGLPLFVTESGLADTDDRYRPWYIEETLRSLYRTIERGADLHGYLHWALLDNFEWDKGFWPGFGLVAVDRKTMKRTPRRASVDTYRRIITKGLDI